MRNAYNDRARMAVDTRRGALVVEFGLDGALDGALLDRCT